MVVKFVLSLIDNFLISSITSPIWFWLLSQYNFLLNGHLIRLQRKARVLGVISEIDVKGGERISLKKKL